MREVEEQLFGLRRVQEVEFSFLKEVRGWFWSFGGMSRFLQMPVVLVLDILVRFCFFRQEVFLEVAFLDFHFKIFLSES